MSQSILSIKEAFLTVAAMDFSVSFPVKTKEDDCGWQGFHTNWQEEAGLIHLGNRNRLANTEINMALPQKSKSRTTTRLS